MTDKLANFKYGLPDHQVAKLGASNRGSNPSAISDPLATQSSAVSLTPAGDASGQGDGDAVSPSRNQTSAYPTAQMGAVAGHTSTDAPRLPSDLPAAADSSLGEDEAVSASRKGFFVLLLLAAAAVYFSILGLPSKPFSNKSPQGLETVTGYLQGQALTQTAGSSPSASLDTLASVQSDLAKLGKDSLSVATFFSKKYHLASVQVQQYVQFAEQAAKAKGLDPALIMAVMSIESNLNPITESNMGAQGLMQVLTPMHLNKLVGYGGASKVFDPEVNITVGATILADCIKLAGSIEGGLKCYVGATGPTDNGYGLKVLAEKERIIKAKTGIFDFSPNNKVLLDIAQNSAATPDQQAAAKTGLAAAVAAASIDGTGMNISNAAIVTADPSPMNMVGVTANTLNKDLGKETNKEVNKEPFNTKDSGKEGSKELVRDTAKDATKESLKELSKDTVKDAAKEVSKDGNKDSSKDSFKDKDKDKDSHGNHHAPKATSTASKPPLVPSINSPAVPSSTMSQGVTYPTITTPSPALNPPTPPAPSVVSPISNQ
jgi:soluble lytic murein transglycosylase-like protein